MSEITFEGTPEQAAALKSCIDKHRGEAGALMPVLHEAQAIYGYLPVEVQAVIAEGLGVSLAEVYGVATFYSQFSLNPKGKHTVSICLGTACYVKGSDKILEAVEHQLGIRCGECSQDRLFSIESCRCVGACGLAPVMIIDGEVYGKLTAKDVPAILDKYISLKD